MSDPAAWTLEPALEAPAIRAAIHRIPAQFRDSAQFVSDALSERAGRTVIVKVETVNPIGAFKGRGTWLAMATLRDAAAIGAGRGVVVASSGNFGQGIAFAGRALGVPVDVFADEHANPIKMARIRRFGATVHLSGHDFDAAREISAAYARERGLELLVDGQYPPIATGAATLAVELTDAIERGELPSPEAIYVPVGNGALIVGVGAWLRATLPACAVVGVGTDGAPAMTLSWRAGRSIQTPTIATAAEGIACRVPVPEALDLMRGRVDDMRLVPDAALEPARRELQDALGILVEGASAASWVGLLADTSATGPGVVIITGGNATAIA